MGRGSGELEPQTAVGNRCRVQSPRAHLDAGGDVVDDADGLGVSKTGQRVRDEVKLHLPGRLSARLLPVDGLAGGALQAAVLGRGGGVAVRFQASGPLPSPPAGPRPPASPPCCHWST